MHAVETAASLPPQDELEARVDLDEHDLQARLDLANLHIARQDYRPAMDQLLEIVSRDRAFGSDVGRTRLIEVLAMADDDEELVADYRARLSALLF
jgi:putative thioredoxin